MVQVSPGAGSSSGNTAVFAELRNYLAGQVVGSTRDETLLHEALKAMLCKSYLQAGKTVGESQRIAASYREAWNQVASDLPTLFDPAEGLSLSDENITNLDRILKSLDLHSAEYDAFGDLYEAFTGDMYKGQSGQFFTPQNAVRLLIELVDPQPGEIVMDPACGAGGFLSGVARRHLSNGEAPEAIAKWLVGIEKDEYLSKLALARLALLTAGSSDVYCGDSLAWTGPTPLPPFPDVSGVDVVLANPPFGSKIVAASADVQSRFELGHKWRKAKGGEWTRGDSLQRNPSPQVLFVERCLDLLRPGGRLGMVVPESLVSSKTHGYVMAYLERSAEIQAVIGMPEDLFKVSGSGGTHTKTCLIVATRRAEPGIDSSGALFMAEAKRCGNDSRGRRIFHDDLPLIAERWRKLSTTPHAKSDHLGYLVKREQIVGGIYAPRYYNPDIATELKRLATTHELLSVQDLIDEGVLEIRTGDEVGKQAYGTGEIPFVRTSDISNWEVKLDPKHGVSEEIFNRLAAKQDVREGDILMVRDGTYLIGTCAYVTEYDTRMVYQSHLLKIRVKDRDRLSPFLLLAALSSAPVKRQIVSKRMTQDIIDSIGDRLREVVLPIPRDEMRRDAVADTVRRSIRDRVEARELARQACLDIVG